MTIKQYFQYLNLKIDLFHRVKELTKSNQTGYGVYHGYLECKTKRIFAIACLGKKLAFHTEIFKYFEYLISKIGLDRQIEELSKSIQTGYRVYWVWSIFYRFRSFRSNFAHSGHLLHFFERNLSGLLDLGLFLQYRQKPTLHTCKTDETDKNRQIPSFRTPFLSVFLSSRLFISRTIQNLDHKLFRSF